MVSTNRRGQDFRQSSLVYLPSIVQCQPRKTWPSEPRRKVCVAQLSINRRLSELLTDQRPRTTCSAMINQTFGIEYVGHVSHPQIYVVQGPRAYWHLTNLG